MNTERLNEIEDVLALGSQLDLRRSPRNPNLNNKLNSPRRLFCIGRGRGGAFKLQDREIFGKLLWAFSSQTTRSYSDH